MTDSLFAARQLNIKNSNKASTSNTNSPDRKQSSVLPKSSTFNSKTPQSPGKKSPIVQSTMSSNDLKNFDS